MSTSTKLCPSTKMASQLLGLTVEKDCKNVLYCDDITEDPPAEDIDLSNEPRDAAIRKLSIGLRPFFSKIERLPSDELTKKLQSLELCSSGNREVLLKRLKKHYERKRLAHFNLLPVTKHPPYYIIIDFEATCNEVNPPDYPHEIIEFPAVLVSTETRTIVDTFREYVCPVINPRLSTFCTNLTGITQKDVDAADPFPSVLDRFQNWLLSHELSNKKSFKIVTDGPWDMAQFLHSQCVISDIPYPKFAESWINLRKVFRGNYRCRTCNLKVMLGILGLKFDGRPHCGVDDATNIAKVVIYLMNDFAFLETNERLDIGTQKYRERALLRASITTLERRGLDRDTDLLQRLRTALALRSRKKKRPLVGFDDPEENCASDEVDEDDVKDEELETLLRPKVIKVKGPLSDESGDETAGKPSKSDGEAQGTL